MKLKEQYGRDFMGKLALGIYNFHKDEPIEYYLNQEAELKYQAVVDKYNESFNRKWSDSQDDNMLDSQDMAEISVRSKATELIGRLSIILWIYVNGNIFLQFYNFIILLFLYLIT